MTAMCFDYYHLQIWAVHRQKFQFSLNQHQNWVRCARYCNWILIQKLLVSTSVIEGTEILSAAVLLNICLYVCALGFHPMVASLSVVVMTRPSSCGIQTARNVYTPFLNTQGKYQHISIISV